MHKVTKTTKLGR